MKIKAIITGSTGMVGEGVLLECLESEHVDSVLVINRESIGMNHPKLKEIIHKDFFDFDSIKNKLKGYNACFYCMGISSVGMKEDEYYNITYQITEQFSNILLEQNPEIIFNYISGTGTDSTEEGKVMWARIKGKTENMVLNKGFKDAYAFRPGAILPLKGIKSKTSWVNTLYLLLRPFYSLLIKMKFVTTSSSVGLAMINSVLHPQKSKFLENSDINTLASIGL